MASKHIEEEVESSSRPRRLSKDAGSSSNFLIQRVYPPHSRNVLEEDNGLEHLLCDARNRAIDNVCHHQNHHLRERENRQDVYNEVGAEVALCNLFRVLHQLAPPKDAGGGGDEASPELQKNVKYVQDIYQRTKNASNYLNIPIQRQTKSVADDDRNVEEEGIEGESDDAGKHEYLIPSLQKIPLRIQNSPLLPTGATLNKSSGYSSFD